MIRSRNGCANCRKRRVKCDQNKPICLKCKRREETCSYVADLLNATDLGHKQPSIRVQKSSKVSRLLIKQADTALVAYSGSIRREDTASCSYPPLLSNELEEIPLSLDNFRDLEFLDPFFGLPNKSMLEHFTSVTSACHIATLGSANTLAESFFRAALACPDVLELTATYGAVHRDLLMGNEKGTSALMFDKCKSRFITLLTSDPHSDLSFIYASTLALIYCDAGYHKEFKTFNNMALQIAESFSVKSLLGSKNSHLCSVLLRLMGSIYASDHLVGNPYRDYTTLNWWPKWSGNYDEVTGLDMNLVPILLEVANLVALRLGTVSSAKLHTVHVRAIRLTMELKRQLLNSRDIQGETDDTAALAQLTILSILLHVYRRVLRISNEHWIVRNLVTSMLLLLESHLPVYGSTLSVAMLLVLPTVASETWSKPQRSMVLRRLEYWRSTRCNFIDALIDDIRLHWSKGSSYILAGDNLP